jgi:hypothetical protein
VAEPANIKLPTARIISPFEILLIMFVQTPTEQPSSPVSHPASYESERWLVAGKPALGPSDSRFGDLTKPEVCCIAKFCDAIVI